MKSPKQNPINYERKGIKKKENKLTSKIKVTHKNEEVAKVKPHLKGGYEREYKGEGRKKREKGRKKKAKKGKDKVIRGEGW